MRQRTFSHVFCSSCGECLGSGDHGFSHCDQHAGSEVCDCDEQPEIESKGEG